MQTQVRRVDTAAQSSMSMLSKDARGTKRVLFEACKAREEIRNVVQRRASKIVLMDRNKFSGTIRKVLPLKASFHLSYCYCPAPLVLFCLTSGGLVLRLAGCKREKQMRKRI